MTDQKDFSKFSFGIIKHYLSPNEAETVDGNKVYRQEKVWVEGLGGFVRCAPYDNHFVYIDPNKSAGRWFAMCTCGSPAVLVGGKAYGHLGTPEGMMLVCKYHLDFGTHTTGEQRWV